MSEQAKQKRWQIRERIKYSSAEKCGISESFDQLWKAAWRVGDWKWSLSWRLFGWEQQPWQMGQLNHCGNGVLDGWLWISSGHRVAVSHVSELSEEFSIQGFETPSSKARDTDKTGGWVYDARERQQALRFSSKEITRPYPIWSWKKAECSQKTKLCLHRDKMTNKQGEKVI